MNKQEHTQKDFKSGKCYMTRIKTDDSKKDPSRGGSLLSPERSEKAPGERHRSWDLVSEKKVAVGSLRTHQAGRTAGAKILRWEWAGHTGDSARRPAAWSLSCRGLFLP